MKIGRGKNLETPIDLGDSDKAKLRSAIWSLISKYISTEIRGKLPIDTLTTEPYYMIAAIAAVFEKTNDAIHRRIEYEDRNLRIKSGQRIAEFVTAHQQLHRSLHLASCTRVDGEIRTIHFIVDSLESHPDFKDAAHAIPLSGIPCYVKTLQDYLLDKEAATVTATQLKTPPPHHPTASSNPDGRSCGRLWRGRKDRTKAQLKKELTEKRPKSLNLWKTPWLRQRKPFKNAPTLSPRTRVKTVRSY